VVRRRPRSLALAALFGVVLVARAQQQPPATPPAVDFVRDIQPIFQKNCIECHGPKKARARLRLHDPAFIAKGGMDGPVVVPGKSNESLLISRVMGLNGDDQMPLDAEPLPDSTVALLRAWIDQGAVMPAADSAAAQPTAAEHWAYVKPVRPELPPVTQKSWARNAIDRFVLARLEHERLSPSAEASKPALLRRLSLDLIGLPPTPQELDAFMADKSPEAYERVVDQLLASPHYGERWARPWLDLARYADTNGYEKDNRRSIWKYRDWVIDALNRDMPFDQFTIEQIAGDMLPAPTTSQRIASGFNRNAMTNEEGGVDPDESMYEVLVDRANTTATVWLGTTLGCAQCHNHKYDPFTQKDYFRLLAFFANPAYDTRVAGDGTRYLEPQLDLATPAQEQGRKEIEAEIARLETVLKTPTPALVAEQEQWEQSIRLAEAQWASLPIVAATATNGVVLTRQPDGSMLASGENPSLTTYRVTVETPVAGVTGIRLEALPDASLPKGGPGRDAYGHFRITGLRIESSPTARAEPAGGMDAATEPAPRFTRVRVDDSAGTFKPEELLGAEGPARRGGAGWSINAMRETTRVPRHAVLIAETPIGSAAATRLTIQIDQLDGTIGQGLGRFRFAATTAQDPLSGADVPARLRPLIAKPASSRTAAEAEELAVFFRSTTPTLKPTRDAIAAAREKVIALKIPSTLVMGERPSFERPSYELRERGSFTARGARVYAGTPSALHPMRDDQPANRLGLARWLVDERNPLVARVAVNRLWEQIFGRGIVETSEDFGAQGSPPSHPELLDWLATELVARKWSQKAIVRTIVTSATYRQASAVSAQLVERDPDNRLAARGPRFRLDAEAVRDGALAVSGLLNAEIGGPSVFPLQPPGIWNMPYNTDKWTTSDGNDRYRRSLYTFWRRTAPFPSFLTFDATSREKCTVRRVRTDTPLQALTLLNDPASFDAAHALASRIIAESPSQSTRDRAAYAIKVVLSREAKAEELERIARLFAEQQAHYESDRDAAAKVLGAGAPSGADLADRAAWTIVANVLLNLDEAVTKM
jgi:mono/diheme cytochrome c family protein